MRSRRPFSHFSIACLLLPLLLTACGGGGGGDSGPPSSGGNGSSGGGSAFSVSIDRSELRFTAQENASVAPQVVLGSGSGTPPDTVYLGSLDLGTAIERVTVESIGAQAKFTVYPRTTLAAGDYRGNLQLFACRDAACASHFPGSPVSVPYVVSITRGLRVAPAVLRLSAVSGASASGQVTVGLPQGQSVFSASSPDSWLTLSDLTPAGVIVNARPMPPGRYLGSLQIATVSGGAHTISVEYEVSGDAATVTRIIPGAARLAFSATAPGAAPAQVLNVTLPSWTRELGAEIRYWSSSGNWLTVAKTGETSLAVSASAAALAAGSYQADIVLTSSAEVAPVTVPVMFTVGAASWSFSGATAFKVDGDTNAGALARDIAIDLPDLPSQGYRVSSASSWLKLSRSGGTTAGTSGAADGVLRASVDLAEMLKLPNFRTYSAEIVVSSLDSRVAPGKLVVTLDKALPELHFVSPHTRLPAEGGVYTLRGRGLAGIVDLERALTVRGATPVRLTRVNDSELRVTLPGAASGEVSFALGNALGVASGAPALRVLPQGAFAYAALATAGAKNGLLFDAERQALYSVNRTLSSVMRFAYGAGGWSVDSISLPGVDAVALSPDGKTLVATARPASIVLLDPATLERKGTYEAAYVGSDINSLQRLAITNDGRAYFNGGIRDGHSLTYFDLVTRTFGGVDGPAGGSGSGWFSVAGDGSRLNVVQTASVSPAPSALYLDSSDAILKPNPVDIKFWYEAAQSLRGERFVEGTYTVWDRDFNTIGKLGTPDQGYFGRTPVLSPDGKRTYVLAYPPLGQWSDAAGKPRVYVYDSSARLVTSTELPLLGYFELADFPTCSISAYECDTRAQGAISPDGKTLFFIGDSKLVVAPIPALTMAAQGARTAGATRAAPAMTRVRMGN